MKNKILPIITICMVAGLLPACQKQGANPGGDSSLIEQEFTTIGDWLKIV